MKKKTKQTLESIKKRTVEIGDCWEWQGYMANGVPYVSHEGKMISVRRLITILSGATLRDGYYVPKCGNAKCVCPDHITFRHEKLHMAISGKKSAYSVARAAKIQAFKREHASKLDVMKVMDIRASDLPNRKLAEIYGVNRSVIWRVKTGRAWIDLNNNPFAGLMR